MFGLISLVYDNHVDNNLKEILMYVYLGSVVNSWPKNIFRIFTESEYFAGDTASDIHSPFTPLQPEI